MCFVTIKTFHFAQLLEFERKISNFLIFFFLFKIEFVSKRLAENLSHILFLQLQPLTWVICLLHCVEKVMQTLFVNYDGDSPCPTYTGEIGSMIKDGLEHTYFLPSDYTFAILL